MLAMPRYLIGLSILSMPFTLTHSFEDFSVGIEQSRFGLPLLPAAFLLSVGYAAQLAAAALSARNEPIGHWLNLVLALVWLMAAGADHLGEVLFIATDAYRAGVISKALEIGIMLTAAAWAVASLTAIRAVMSRNSGVSSSSFGDGLGGG
jgi:hypothetical protein